MRRKEIGEEEKVRKKIHQNFEINKIKNLS